VNAVENGSISLKGTSLDLIIEEKYRPFNVQSMDDFQRGKTQSMIRLSEATSSVPEVPTATLIENTTTEAPTKSSNELDDRKYSSLDDDADIALFPTSDVDVYSSSSMDDDDFGTDDIRVKIKSLAAANEVDLDDCGDGYHYLSLPKSGTIIERELTSKEATAVAQLKLRLGEDTMAAFRPLIRLTVETETTVLLRFLKARKMDVEGAAALVIANQEWRSKEGINELIHMDVQEILGCHPKYVWPYLPCWMQGFDKLGQPVIYKEWGNFWYREIMKHTTEKSFVRYHIWMNEMGLRAMGQQSVKLGRRVDKFTCICNAKGFVPGSMRHGAMAFLKHVILVDQNHYPERLAAIIVINAPRLITVVWNAVKRMLDPVTREKVQIYSAEKKWRPVIERMIDPDQLPDIYGGTAKVQIPDWRPLPC
jgi:hypothetical protein